MRIKALPPLVACPKCHIICWQAEVRTCGRLLPIDAFEGKSLWCTGVLDASIVPDRLQAMNLLGPMT